MHDHKAARPAPALAESEPRNLIGLSGAIENFDNLRHGSGQLIDRFGNSHYSEAIFRNWSPAAIKAMGIRRVPEGGAK